MSGCESWTIKKSEHRRTDAFELWCWRRLLVPWTARRSNQPILKEINPEYSSEGLMLKLQYFGHLVCRADSDAGKDWGQKEKKVAEDEMVRQHHWLNGHEFEQTLGNSGGQGSLACSHGVHGVAVSDATEHALDPELHQLHHMHSLVSSSQQAQRRHSISIPILQIEKLRFGEMPSFPKKVVFRFLESGA